MLEPSGMQHCAAFFGNKPFMFLFVAFFVVFCLLVLHKFLLLPSTELLTLVGVLLGSAQEGNGVLTQGLAK